MTLPRYLISPPVGAWLGAPNAIRVLGSYTLLPRPGRLGQVLRTVRPVPGGWINAIGLRNPGVGSIERYSSWPSPGDVFKHLRRDRVYSLAGMESGDWEQMMDLLRRRSGTNIIRVELNLSCPNVHEYGITRREIELFTSRTSTFEVIAKLPPTADVALRLAYTCAEAGVSYLHLSNTIPSPIGGISGDALRRVNLPLVEHVAKQYPTIPIIAGGGIKSHQHVIDYENAGARHFSISTGYLRWRLSRRTYRAGELESPRTPRANGGHR